MLLHAIDKLPSPALFVNSRGDMLATNQKAIDLLSQSQVGKIMASIAECGPDGPKSDETVERVERVGDSNLWLCLLRTDSPAAALSQ
jgi:hypothetical protein